VSSNGLPILRTSERGAFHKCWQQWWWAYRMGLGPKHIQADARWFGIGIHLALAEWYQRGTRRGPHPAETFAAWVGDEIAYAKTWLDENYEEAKWEDAKELGTAMLEAYVDHWGRDPQWHIISVEQQFKVKIIKAGEPVALFASRWDGVARDLGTGDIILLEHKTASQVNTAYLEMDDQAGSYCAVASQVLRAKKVLKPTEKIAGIQYNFLRKAKPDTRPVNELGERLNKDQTVSLRQPPPMFVRPDLVERNDRMNRTQLERIADEVGIMNLLRQGAIPVTKTITRDCPRCDFWIMCQLHERGGNAWKEVMKSDFVQRSPYQDIEAGQVIKSAAE
jgi:PD-(D/E)XK nuclease superfamily